MPWAAAAFRPNASGPQTCQAITTSGWAIGWRLLLHPSNDMGHSVQNEARSHQDHSRTHGGHCKSIIKKIGRPAQIGPYHDSQDSDSPDQNPRGSNAY